MQLRRRVWLAVSFLLAASLTSTVIACTTGGGTIFPTYNPQTPYVWDIDPSVRECRNMFYLTGDPPFSLPISFTATNGLVVTKTVNGQTTTLADETNNPRYQTVVPLPWADMFIIGNPPGVGSQQLDSTYPIEYATLEIFPASTAYAPPAQLALYSISEKSAGVTGSPIVPPFAVQWGQKPPPMTAPPSAPSCWFSGPPTKTSTKMASNQDFQLEFTSPTWQTGGPGSGVQHCSSPDTFDVQISTDPMFRYVAHTITLAPGPQPSGDHDVVVPDSTTTQQFKAYNDLHYQCGWNGGSLTGSPDPIALSFGGITAPDVTYDGNGSAKPMFFRVRGEYYTAVGAWSAVSTFPVPEPQQSFASGVDTCNYNNPPNFSLQAPCITWQYQYNVASWDLQVGTPGTALGNGANVSALLINTNVPDTPQGGSQFRDGTNANQFCGPSSISNFNPYCAFAPTLRPGPFVWAVRAHYTSGHVGPWSQTFAGTWPAPQTQPPPPPGGINILVHNETIGQPASGNPDIAVNTRLVVTAKMTVQSGPPIPGANTTATSAQDFTDSSALSPSTATIFVPDLQPGTWSYTLSLLDTNYSPPVATGTPKTCTTVVSTASHQLTFYWGPGKLSWSGCP